MVVGGRKREGGRSDGTCFEFGRGKELREELCRCTKIESKDPSLIERRKEDSEAKREARKGGIDEGGR